MLKKNKSLENTTALVTGGAGFIGSHLTRALIKKGCRVKVLDNISRNVNCVQDLRTDGTIKFVKGDICDLPLVLQTMKGIDYVFHQASICLRRCNAFPKEAIEVILNGSHNVFYAAVHEKVKKVIYASTSSVYGEPEYLPIDEKHPTNPATPYGATKLCADHFAQFFARKHGMKFIGLRYFNIYGPNQSTDAYYTSVINAFIKRILASASPIISGNGEQTFDFTYVSDAVRANLMALESDIENEIFNVGYGGQCSIRTLAELILKLTGSNQKPEFVKRDISVTRRQCDGSKINRLLGFKCEVSLKDGLRSLIESVKMYPEAY